jgi:hypothetical protein
MATNKECITEIEGNLSDQVGVLLVQFEVLHTTHYVQECSKKIVVYLFVQ